LNFESAPLKLQRAIKEKKKRGGRGEGRERENGKRGRPGEPRAACEKEIVRVSLSFEHKFGQNKKNKFRHRMTKNIFKFWAV
jgi:hypothetical protein